MGNSLGKCGIYTFAVQNCGKFDPTLLGKIKQMWHLQMVCSKFAIKVNPFFSSSVNTVK